MSTTQNGISIYDAFNKVYELSQEMAGEVEHDSGEYTGVLSMIKLIGSPSAQNIEDAMFNLTDEDIFEIYNKLFKGKDDA